MVSHEISCQISRWPPVVKVHHLIKILIFQSSVQHSSACDWLTTFTQIYSRIKVRGNNSAERSECSHQLHLVFPGRARPSIHIKKPVTAALPKRIVRSCASLYGYSCKTGEQEHMISPDLCLLVLCKTTRSVLLFNTILVELNNVQPFIFFNIKHDLILNQIFQWLQNKWKGCRTTWYYLCNSSLKSGSSILPTSNGEHF